MGSSHFKNILRPDEFQALLYKTREERTVALQRGQAHPPPAAPPPTEPAPDATDQLRRLKLLHEDGIITDAEYAEKRQKLVDEI